MGQNYPRGNLHHSHARVELLFIIYQYGMSSRLFSLLRLVLLYFAPNRPAIGHFPFRCELLITSELCDLFSQKAACRLLSMK